MRVCGGAGHQAAQGKRGAQANALLEFYGRLFCDFVSIQLPAGCRMRTLFISGLMMTCSAESVFNFISFLRPSVTLHPDCTFYPAHYMPPYRCLNRHVHSSAHTSHAHLKSQHVRQYRCINKLSYVIMACRAISQSTCESCSSVCMHACICGRHNIIVSLEHAEPTAASISWDTQFHFGGLCNHKTGAECTRDLSQGTGSLVCSIKEQVTGG